MESYVSIPFLMFSFSQRYTIEFRDTDNLAEVVLTHSVAPHQPGALCTMSSSVLVYEDQSESPPEIHWLDCRGTGPRLLDITVRPNISHIEDICCVEHEHDYVLVVLPFYETEHIHAYSCSTGELKWKAEKNVSSAREAFRSRGVAGNDSDRLFVGDYTTDSIHVFSVSDGQQLRRLTRMADQGYGDVWQLHWSNDPPSLIVGHIKNGRLFISSMQ